MDFTSNKSTELQEDFTNNYEDITSVFSRRILLYNTIKYLKHIKDQINQLPPDEPLTTKSLLAIRP